MPTHTAYDAAPHYPEWHPTCVCFSWHAQSPTLQYHLNTPTYASGLVAWMAQRILGCITRRRSGSIRGKECPCAARMRTGTCCVSTTKRPCGVRGDMVLLRARRAPSDTPQPCRRCWQCATATALQHPECVPDEPVASSLQHPCLWADDGSVVDVCTCKMASDAARNRTWWWIMPENVGHTFAELHQHKRVGKIASRYFLANWHAGQRCAHLLCRAFVVHGASVSTRLYYIELLTAIGKMQCTQPPQ